MEPTEGSLALATLGLSSVEVQPTTLTVIGVNYTVTSADSSTDGFLTLMVSLSSNFLRRILS